MLFIPICLLIHSWWLECGLTTRQQKAAKSLDLVLEKLAQLCSLHKRSIPDAAFSIQRKRRSSVAYAAKIAKPALPVCAALELASASKDDFGTTLAQT
jgi:hypothetical protein